MAELIYKEEAFEIVGAAMDVYYTMGLGFLEPVYQEALAITRHIVFIQQRTWALWAMRVR